MVDVLENAPHTVTWTCFSCGQTVEYQEPVVNPQFLTAVSGRTTFRIDGEEVHQCSEGSYHAPLPTLRRLH
jgi:hypothetical protein